MARSPRQASESSIYHVISRGAGKQIIFEDDLDRQAFLAILAKALEEHSVKLLCFCLMSNHFHLLLMGELAAISQGMGACCGSYAMRFNERHGRVGHLFQDRFKSEPVQDDAYLITVVRYIHQNPVAAGLCTGCDYSWSSYRCYMGEKGPCACSTELVLGIFGSREAFKCAHDTLVKAGECLEAEASRRCAPTMDDALAVQVAGKIIGQGSIENLKSWEKPQRDDALRNLHGAGLTIRQIERLTGIGRNTVARALKK